MTDRSAQEAIADELLDYNERGLGSDHWGSCDADFVAEMALAALKDEGWRVVRLKTVKQGPWPPLFRIVEEASSSVMGFIAALKDEGWRVVKLEPSETWSRMALERPYRIVEEA